MPHLAVPFGERHIVDRPNLDQARVRPWFSLRCEAKRAIIANENMLDDAIRLLRDRRSRLRRWFHAYSLEPTRQTRFFLMERKHFFHAVESQSELESQSDTDRARPIHRLCRDKLIVVGEQVSTCVGQVLGIGLNVPSAFRDSK